MVVTSALRTGRLYPLPPGDIPGIHFCYRLSPPQGHSATGNIMSIKNLSGPTGNRTSDLPACRVNNSEGGQKHFSVHLPTAKVPRCPLNMALVGPMEMFSRAHRYVACAQSLGCPG